jgi:hypothetical protein
MRASSLSNKEVIALLNSYFVPVYVSNEDYGKDGPASAAEKAEKERIYREALKAKLSTGTVHAYVLTPEGHPIDSLHVANAAKPEQTIQMLKRAVEKFHLTEGKPVVPPSKQSTPPKGEPGALTLHLTARVLKGGAWGDYPAENWIVLEPAQLKKLLPKAEVNAGESWQLDSKEAAKFLTYFYPATENNDVRTNQIEHEALTATIISITDGVARARLDGSLRMIHSFYRPPYPKPTAGRGRSEVVETKLIGLLDFEPGTETIRSLRLVTDGATYGGGTFAVAVQSER